MSGNGKEFISEPLLEKEPINGQVYRQLSKLGVDEGEEINTL